MELAGVAEGVHEGRDLERHFLLLHFLHDVKIILDLLLLDHLFVALGDAEREMVAEVFVEHLVETEDEDCGGVAWVQLHCFYLCGHGEGLFGVPEGVGLCIESE